MSIRFRKVFALLLVTLLLAACNLPSQSKMAATAVAFPTIPAETGNAPIPQTGESCLIGNWLLDPPSPETLTGLLKQQAGQSIQVQQMSGQIGVQFAPDGQLTLLSNGLQAEGKTDYRGMSLPVSIRLTGQSTAGYTNNSDEGTLTLIQPDLSSLHITAHAWIIPVYSASLSSLLGTAGVDSSGNLTLSYTCNNESLTLAPEGSSAGAVLQRAP